MIDIQMLLWLTAGGVGLLLWRSFFPSYFSEKGKNKAAKEDSAEITTTVEEVKTAFAAQLKELEHRNSLFVEQLRTTQQLRMAALDKRLVAHQEAFTLWRRLLLAAHTNDTSKVVDECQEWWDSNCLFLSSESRRSFNDAFFSASDHQSLIRNNADAELIKKSWAIIMKAGEELVSAVELPSLGQRESEKAQSGE